LPVSFPVQIIYCIVSYRMCPPAKLSSAHSAAAEAWTLIFMTYVAYMQCKWTTQKCPYSIGQ